MNAVQLTPQTAKVLVVDDAPANLIALGAVLKPLGLNIVEARSGMEALERLQSETFALALLDVQMPIMDGFEVAQRAREMDSAAEMPIIFLTAIHRDELYAKRGYATGAADYITKPFDADMLRARVKAFVDLFQQRERVRAKEVNQRTRERDDALAKLESLLESERTLRREAEIANNAKDEFLATVSHELRTPLNAILGWSIIARDMTREAPVQRALTTIERNARSQMRIIEDVLDIGRIISGKLRLEMGDVQLEDPLRGAVEAVRPAAEAKEVALDVEIEPNIGHIFADAERLQQIVWNVLSNAIKFTPKGGHVKLTVERESRDVIIRVRDDGQGIAPEFLPHVFEPFRQADGSTTRRHGGLGLGLAIVRQLVHAHGGSVNVDSAGTGKGSTFTIQLPARVAPIQAGRAEDGSAPHEGLGQLDGVRALIVDDDDDARGLLLHILEAQGATVVAVKSAEEALAAIDRAPPDVLLSDLSMPSIDGYGLIRRGRALPADRGGRIPAIAVTAHAKGPLTEGLFDAGFQAHVTKPVDPTQLVFLVANVSVRT